MKSYKREVAFGLLVLWTVLVVKVFFFTIPESITDLGGILAGLTVWIVPPCLLVFGFHAHIKKDEK